MRTVYLSFAVSVASVVMAAAMLIGTVNPGAAQSYHYPVDEIAAEMGMTTERFERWWSQAPASMRSELTSQPLAKWGPSVICNVLGFRIGPTEGADRREKKYADRVATADRWNADGTYKGPSEACLARNKTDKWGRLICD